MNSELDFPSDEPKVNGRHPPAPALLPLDPDDPEIALVAAVVGDVTGGIWEKVGHAPVEIFSNPEARKIWRAISNGTPLDDGMAVIRDCELDMRRFIEWTSLDRTGIYAHVHLHAVASRWKDREMSRLAGQIATTSDLTPEQWADRATRIGSIVQSITGTSRDIPKAIPLASLKYPSGDDKDILLGNDDYLGRGGGMLFVSHAGAGKSSWIMDAALSWGMGKPWMGIRSNGTLKSLIIQAEDSDRYLGKVAASFVHANSLTDAQTTELCGNGVVVRLKGCSGAKFFSALRQLTALHKPDLVVINPIYLYAEGDISKSEYAQPFLVGLDAVNKDESFAYILVHHTGKPQAKDKSGKRASLDDWETVYMGFGSSYLANWPRCSALLEPVAGQSGRFMLKLGKAGRNAGITKEVPHGAFTRTEPTTSVAMKYSEARIDVDGVDRPEVYWVVDNDAVPSEGEGSRPGSGAGKPSKYLFEDFRSMIPTSNEPALPLASLHRECLKVKDIPKNRLFDALKIWAREGKVEMINEAKKAPTYRRLF